MIVSRVVSGADVRAFGAGCLLLVPLLGVAFGVPLVAYDAFYGNPVRSMWMENATEKHLLNLGYGSDELLDVEAFYSMKKDAGIKRTRAYVIFRDEPEEKYVYVQREGGQIQQGCSYFDENTGAVESDYTEKRKHMVKDCVRTLFS
ncbi:hypothetical protein ABZ671_10875 [Micromonospora sp. NPDC006766]|uniref:hypothetical protein n=1 Tax=Micromonospora sp. NPDC006766 TaxID=3154778 RepID=UPI003402054E